MTNIRNNKRQTGQKGEDLAVEYLSGLDYEIRERNFRFGHLEIDIIAFDGDMMVVAEVKSVFFGLEPDPVQYLSRCQFRNLTKAAAAYLHQQQISPEVRFDLLCVSLYRRPPIIRHFRDVWMPNK
ncbi:MAG: YraN family protein [Sphingomonadales bacterium]|nr:YraN family protein [Sphingomonadales bacterium]